MVDQSGSEAGQQSIGAAEAVLMAEAVCGYEYSCDCATDERQQTQYVKWILWMGRVWLYRFKNAIVAMRRS